MKPMYHTVRLKANLDSANLSQRPTDYSFWFNLGQRFGYFDFKRFLQEAIRETDV